MSDNCRYPKLQYWRKTKRKQQGLVTPLWTAASFHNGRRCWISSTALWKSRMWFSTSTPSTDPEWEHQLSRPLRGVTSQNHRVASRTPTNLLSWVFLHTFSLDLVPLTCLQIVGFFLSLPRLSDPVLVPKLNPCAPSSFLTRNPHLSARWTRTYLDTNGVYRHHHRNYAT